jgi:hypothetical protein
MHSVDGSNAEASHLVIAKSKIAGTKEKTVPKMELEAALLLAKLIQRTAMNLKIPSNQVLCFSDSQVVLAWLKGPAEKFKTFVCNRVSAIGALIPPTQWCSINTSENPADLGTRPNQKVSILQSQMWLNGPIKDFNGNKEMFQAPEEGDRLELRKETAVLVSVVIEDDFIKRFSSYNRLIRTVAYVLRFKNLCRKISVEKLCALTSSEIESSLIMILRVTQVVTYGDEVNRLLASLPIKSKSSLKSLCPILNSNNLLCVGGRLENSNFSESKKYPLILPANSHFAKLYVRFIHVKFFHANRKFLAAFLSARYWFVGGTTNIIKKTVRECVVCRRFKATTMEQIMGQLPAQRLHPARPFTYTGVDYAGPFQSKCVGHRSIKFNEVYLAVFICLTTRTVHLEIASELTTHKFIEAFQRFIGRRGCPRTLFSDNATNFTGAAKLLAQFLNSNDYKSAMAAFCGDQGIQWSTLDWSFNPPIAPHQGGGWEAAVKSAKYHLVRVIGQAVLTFEEYTTLFCRIEAILNSRPLCFAGQGSEILTPAHFLTGASLLTIPEDESEYLPLGVRYQLSQNIVTQFWRRWSVDYLAQLQQRYKWRNREVNLHVGEIVLVKAEKVKPALWPMARVTAVYPGPDGAVRVADVEFGGAIKRRAITSLVQLVGQD